MHYKGTRFIELDLARSFAIIGMLFYHILWDLDYFGYMPLDQNLYAHHTLVPIAFFLIIGICLSISYDKDTKVFKPWLTRGGKLMAVALLISLFTYLIFPGKPIVFGVLHCIAFSIIFSTLFMRFKYFNIIIASVLISMGLYLKTLPCTMPQVPYLLIGVYPTNIWEYTIDYFPIFPWFGVCLLGVGIGNILYSAEGRKFKIPQIVLNSRIVYHISKVGKHSLKIYLIHQPLIGGTFFIWNYFSLPIPTMPF